MKCHSYYNLLSVYYWLGHTTTLPAKLINFGKVYPSQVTTVLWILTN